MATGRITQKRVETLAEAARRDGARLYLWDSELKGFGVMATPNGVISYVIQYRLGGRGAPSRRGVIGRHPALKPESARTVAKTKLGQVAAGVDVVQERLDQRRKLSAETFSDALDLYGVTKARLRSWPEAKRCIELNAGSALISRPIVTITRGDIGAAVDRTAARSPAVARGFFAYMRPFFKWCTERGIIDVNPMASLSSPPTMPKRNRVLSDDEIRAFWKATGDLGYPFGPLLRVLLLTGQRREEVGGLDVREIDRRAATWTIPGRRTKNGKDHLVDLSPVALQILSGTGKTEGLCFTTTVTTPPLRVSRRKGPTEPVQRPPSGFTRAKARLDKLMLGVLRESAERRGEPADHIALPHWRIHDLRRTAATGMAALGYAPHIVERVLNHLSGVNSGLVRVYQHHEYREERKAALLAWSARVIELVAEGPSEPEAPAAQERCA